MNSTALSVAAREVSPPALTAPAVRILLLEDTPSDAELIERELHKAGITFTALRVETRATFIRALHDFAPDIVLLDYKLPAFDGRAAMDIVRQQQPDLPVIMLSGVLGDDAAVALIKAGACDFVLKDRLARLGSAVTRALAEAARKKAGDAAEQAAPEPAMIGLEPPVRILLLEDAPPDAEMIERELHKAGINFTALRVETREAFIRALHDFAPDIVLSDFTLSAFDGREALDIVRRDFPGLPVIMVTGALGDEAAVELIKAGARDFVLKDRPARLGSAVRRALADMADRKTSLASEQAARTIETRSRALIENISDVIVLTRGDGALIYISPSIKLMGGYEASDLAGRNILEFLHPDDMPAYGKLVEQIFSSSGAVIQAEFRYRHADGSWLNIESRSRNLLAVPEIGGVVITLHDVTKKRRATARMQESEARLNSVLNSLNDAVWSQSIETGQMLYLNRAAEQLYARSEDEFYLNPQAWKELIHPDDRERMVASDAALMATGAADREYRIVLKDGSVRWLHSRAKVIADGAGKALRVDGIVTDITERKLTMVQLRESEEYNRSIVESGQDCLKVLSLEGRLLDMSTPGRTLMCVTDFEKIRNADWFSFWQGEDREAARRAVAAACAGGTGRFQGFCPTMDGTPKWWEVVVTPIHGADGKPVRLLGVSRDITERKQAYDQIRSLNADLEARVTGRTAELAQKNLELQQAMRTKDLFLATMSHEIRTPMNGVLGMLELLSMTRLDAEQRTSLEVVRESGRTLQRIIDDILDFSKIEAGKMDILPAPTSIRQVVQSVRDIYSGVASSKGLLLKHSIDSRISPALWVDAMRLRQILNNLVSNAIKFTAKGSIEIKAELVERNDGADRLVLSVTDTGIGIAPEFQKHMFQPFMQAETSTATRFGGTGLGLSICRRLAEMMGGSIEMDSEPGKGTRMVLKLYLPIADSQDSRIMAADPVKSPVSITARTSRTPPTLAQAQLDGTLVLLADDHPTNRLVLARQLNTLGYAVETAENGRQALALWLSGRFGLVIADCNMPEMDGYELAQRIRRHESVAGAKRVPIIACTANAMGGEAANCIVAGMDDYLSKPVELAALARKLDQWLPLPVQTAPAPTPATVQALLDRSVLAAISGGDATLERQILDTFRRSNDGDVTRLSQAVGRNDGPEIRSVSHRIQGASRMVGAIRLADACRHLEYASGTNDWPAVQAGLPVFHHELEQLNAYFDTH